MVQQQQQSQFLSSRLGASTNVATQHHHSHRDDHFKSGATSGHSERAHYKGHQRRQSVARLLPDISKLRLLSWLVEASNELINCDIAIMDGVYAKLNRSRESLLFWQQQQQQYQQGQAVAATTTTAAAASQTAAAAALKSNRKPPARPPPARPPPPTPPSVGPISSGKLLLLRQQHQQQQQQKIASKQLSSSDSKQQERRHHKKSASSSRNHHSLPLTNYDASSLAAVSLRSNAATIPSTSSNDLHNNNNNKLHQQQATPPVVVARRCAKGQKGAAATSAAASRASNCSSLPVNLFCDSGNLVASSTKRLLTPQASRKASDISTSATSNTSAHGEQQSDDDHSDSAADSDADSNSSAASSSEASTTSSGIHGAASLSSSASSSTSASSASCASSNDTASSFGDTAHVYSNDNASMLAGNNSNAQQQQHHQPQQSSAEQLSERIRRSVVEHNYLQTLLVNVIRQHDRLIGNREQLQNPFNNNKYNSAGASFRDYQFESSNSSLSMLRAGAAMTPPLSPLRIDLTELADSLDDGCLCSCHGSLHNLRIQLARQDLSDSGGGLGSNSSKSSTLPANQSSSSSASLAMSSTLSLFQPKSQSARKLRRKLKGGTTATSGLEEMSRADIIQKFSDKLCENCFETHYWLHSCSQFAPLEFASTLGDANSSSIVSNVDSQQRQQEQLDNLNSIISLRNATFIKLVQQQVRSTISKSIELIDLIRKEIKSPESIKQKQLMKCFSASVQLLTSVANYVVPTQDISTFIPNELTSSMIYSSSGQQQTILFNLPPSDFDHLLLYPTVAATSLSDNNNPNSRSSPSSYLTVSSSSTSTNPSSSQSANGGHHHHNLNLNPLNYHLASAPEIPIRRRNRMLQSLEETPPSLSPSASQVAKMNDDSSPELQVSRSSGGSEGNQLKSSSVFNSGGRLRAMTTTTTHASDNQLTAKQISGSNINSENATNLPDSSSGASSNNSSASSSIARGTVQQSSLERANTSGAILKDQHEINNRQQQRRHQQQLQQIQRKSPTSHDLASMLSTYETTSSLNRHQHHQQQEDDYLAFQSSRQPKFWQSSKFNFIKKLLQVKQQRLLRQQSKDRRIYNNKVQNKFRLVMMDLTHFNKSQQLLATENGVNSLLTSMRNVLEFGLYLTVKLY